jgi:hypothetical protein
MEIPICKILKKVTSSLVWPLDKNKSLFLGVKTKAVTTNVLRTCKEAGLKNVRLNRLDTLQLFS